MKKIVIGCALMHSIFFSFCSLYGSDAHIVVNARAAHVGFVMSVGRSVYPRVVQGYRDGICYIYVGPAYSWVSSEVIMARDTQINPVIDYNDIIIDRVMEYLSDDHNCLKIWVTKFCCIIVPVGCASEVNLFTQDKPLCRCLGDDIGPQLSMILSDVHHLSLWFGFIAKFLILSSVMCEADYVCLTQEESVFFARYPEYAPNTYTLRVISERLFTEQFVEDELYDVDSYSQLHKKYTKFLVTHRSAPPVQKAFARQNELDYVVTPPGLLSEDRDCRSAAFDALVRGITESDGHSDLAYSRAWQLISWLFSSNYSPFDERVAEESATGSPASSGIDIDLDSGVEESKGSESECEDDISCDGLIKKQWVLVPTQRSLEQEEAYEYYTRLLEVSDKILFVRHQTLWTPFFFNIARCYEKAHESAKVEALITFIARFGPGIVEKPQENTKILSFFKRLWCRK